MVAAEYAELCRLFASGWIHYSCVPAVAVELEATPDARSPMCCVHFVYLFEWYVCGGCNWLRCCLLTFRKIDTDLTMCVPLASWFLYFLAARALRYISLPLLSVIKSLSPVGIAGIESMQGIYVSKGTYFAMLLIVLANVVSVYYDVEYQPLGYLWALGNVCFNVVYVTLLRRLDCDASNIEKTLHNNFLLVMLTLPFGVSSGDVLKFAAALAATSTTFKAMYFVSCVLAAAIGATVFWVIQATSGSTLSFVGTSNKILVVALGAILFEVKISPHGWFGIILGVTASICFTVSKAQQEAAASALKSRETPADADNKNEERPVVGDPADDSSEDGVTNDRTHFLRRGVTGS